MRVKRGVAAHKKHKKIRQSTKGMTLAHRSSVKRGKQAATRSLQYAYRDRRTRKRTFRMLWNSRINSASRAHGLSYSRFMASLKTSGIILDRKVLAEIAISEPKAFEALAKLSGKK